jgi:hypothetical protein
MLNRSSERFFFLKLFEGDPRFNPFRITYHTIKQLENEKHIKNTSIDFGYSIRNEF